MSKATKAQINYIEVLMEKCGYDEEGLDINLDTISIKEASEVISSLKDELGWD